MLYTSSIKEIFSYEQDLPLANGTTSPVSEALDESPEQTIDFIALINTTSMREILKLFDPSDRLSIALIVQDFRRAIDGGDSIRAANCASLLESMRL